MTSGIVEIENYIQSKEFLDHSNSNGSLQETALAPQKTSMEREIPSTSDYLVSFSTNAQSYCVGYVDIVNSTKISASLPTSELSQYYEMFLNSMSKIVEKFGGKVIKNIGDCLLFYFPNSVNGSDVGLASCLDCGLAMSNAQSIISEEMVTRKLPKLNYRISSDFGKVIRMNNSLSSSIDLIGPPVNMCAKINNCAGKNDFVIGNDLCQVTKKLKTYQFAEIQGVDVGFKYPYPVYRVSSSYR
ncbi:MAG: adenylate/guanylate cyclase domain-containing protein [Nitrosopumilus sp.]|nr:adenylate/guanylate cyclase domain-containing protein [Nitrosopumilus sp.]